ncbi:MAG: glycosyltransferase [Mangrovibacterium sp.]
MKYPKILVLAIGKINYTDNSNNGLLLRNLFGNWSTENLAQIYSSGDNGDKGFFAHYYKLGSKDRILGSLFYRMKSNEISISDKRNMSLDFHRRNLGIISTIRRFLIKILVETGFFEILFRPILSNEMLKFISEFQPDIIFAQGYNLTFTMLPIMMKQKFKLPIVYYPTDDWPADLYFNKDSYTPFITPFVRSVVTSASKKIVDASSVLIAFNRFMKEEYQLRYKKDFAVLMHGDLIGRFDSLIPIRTVSTYEIWLVSTGVFDEHRYPLLYDLDNACTMLLEKGYSIKATIFPVNDTNKIHSDGNPFKNIYFEPCPSHDLLASFLKGADILILIERFDSSAEDIKLCISSKAHLFMFSGRPIIVYSSQKTGIARYAKEGEWAIVEGNKDSIALANDIEKLILDKKYSTNLIKNANFIIWKNHDLLRIQKTFKELVCSAIRS